MKKIISILMIFLLCACQSQVRKGETEYENILEMIKNQESFISKSDYFNLSYEITIDENEDYRFYLFLDSPKMAMYDVTIFAIDKEMLDENLMAANAGIFDTTEYNMIPNQVNRDLGYYAGIMVSGIIKNPETSLYIYVEWKNKELSLNTKQFIELKVKYLQNENQ